MVGSKALAKGTTKVDLQRATEKTCSMLYPLCVATCQYLPAQCTLGHRNISKIASSVHEVVPLIRVQAEVSQSERVSGENRSERLAVERNSEEMAYNGRNMSRVFGPKDI